MAASFARQFSNFLLALATHGLSVIVLPFLSAWLVRSGIVGYRGLLARFDVPVWAAAIATLLWLEFAQYLWHRLSHAVPILWRLHRVHHSDLEVDSSTSIRHHPFEDLAGAIAMAPFVLLLGAAPILVLGWSLLAALADAFNHGNIKLPVPERWLSRLIVTPRFHVVHHSSERSFTDSNYSKVIPLFDFLFGTAKEWTPQQESKAQLGLEDFRSATAQRIDKLLLQPFSDR